MNRSEKKKMAKRDKMLIAAVLAITWFTAACLIVQLKAKVTPSATLIKAYFAFWAVEIWQLSSITKKKISTKKENEK